MDQLYRKTGNKYTPIGVCFKTDYLTPGLWLVTKRDNSRSSQNILCRISDIDNIDLNTYIKLLSYKDDIFDRAFKLKQDNITLSDLMDSIFEIISSKCYG